MKRLAILALFLLASGCLWAQAPITQTTIVADHPLAGFQVDGESYVGQATFTWPENSVHFLRFIVTEEVAGENVQRIHGDTVRLYFQGWEATGADVPNLSEPRQMIVATPQITRYRAVLSVKYLTRLRFYDSPGDPKEGCASPAMEPPKGNGPGIVFIAGECFASSADLWLEAGIYQLLAYAYPGHAFIGWNLNEMGTNSFLRTVTISAPTIIRPEFRPAKRIKFITEPRGLKLLIDRTLTPTPKYDPCEDWQVMPVSPPPGVAPLCPGEVDWAVGSRHVIGAEAWQDDGFGSLWVFDGFSNGAGNHELYEVKNLDAETIVGQFTRGGRVSFLTSPTGLRLSVNGVSNWPAYNFVARPGDVYELSAPAEQTGADGRRYVFKGWSNGGEAAQSVTVPVDVAEAGYRLTAQYELLSQVVIRSEPAGTAVEVDGVSCTTPCSIDRPAGTEVNVTAPESRTISHSHRLEFSSWSDGGPRQRTLTVEGATSVILTANYTTMFLLETSVNPEGGATITAQPPSADGFYAKGTYVTLTAEEREGYRFRRWVGDLESVYHSGGLVMSVPRSAVAMMDELDLAGKAVVQNAAGETPETVVAAGSIIAIYGTELAPYLDVGAGYPLPQTLAGVTVRIHDRILVLLFVSPNQINAILPYDLLPGDYTVLIQRAGKPDATAPITLVRNAPGVFTRLFNGEAFVLASHEDGTPVTPESPARRDEVVSIYGTGFGPYEMAFPYGFTLPQSPEYKLMEPPELFAGDIAVTPEFAGGAAGYSGTDVFRVRISDELPAGATVEFRGRSGGRDSNTALLPIE